MIVWLILADLPFHENIKVSNWDISPDKDQAEVTMALSSRWVVASWINMDDPNYYAVNQLAVSSDYGYTWEQVTRIAATNSSCWVGDPSLASDPNNPDKFYWAGMIWCQVNNSVRGEIYFCTNDGPPNDSDNWSCRILPPNDNWNYFKDKPWLLTRNNNGTTEILIVFTAEGYGSTSLSTYEMISIRSTDGGNTWEAPVRVDPGYTSTVAYTFYDPSTGIVHMSKNCIGCYSGYDVAIEYYTSTNFGGNWTYKAGVIGTVPEGQASSCPHFDRPVKIGSSIAAIQQDILIAAITDSDTDGGCDLMLAQSPDGGNTWNRFLYASGDIIHPFIASNYSDSFYIMIQARNNSTQEWQTQMFINSGSSWYGIIRISDHNYPMNEYPAGHDYNTFLYMNGNLFAIWGDDYYNEDAGSIYYTTTIDPTPIAVREEYAGAIVSSGFLYLERETTIFDTRGRIILDRAKGNVHLKPGIYILHNGRERRLIVIR